MSVNLSLLVLGGCVLGAVQLVAGIALGMWLRRCDRADGERGRREMLRANMIAKRLQELVDEMSNSAHEHRAQLDRASHLLTSSDGETDEAIAELVVDVIGNIVRANHDLQSQLETAENRLEKQAKELEAHISRSLTDPLTGLPNRREFNERLEERMSVWKRRKEVFSLLMLDVDYFKKLNDEHGHLAGDQMLAAIARAVRGAVRREDVVARYGGEEIAVLLPSTSLKKAKVVAEKVRETVSRTVVPYNDQDISATVSGGLATITANDTAESIIERADEALYQAKAAGRNRTCIHDGSGTELANDSAVTLVDVIQRKDAGGQLAASATGADAADFGVYLEREAISPQLAQACDELRQCIEQRAQQNQRTESGEVLSQA
jgi:diguanylate cyclase